MSKRQTTRNPKGGLAAAGRAEFKRRDGSNLKPGVTPRCLAKRRKGSWATRFYGRKQLPKLVDEEGKPTRFALSAHAWREPVPKTEAATRKIAQKGKRLLEK